MCKVRVIGRLGAVGTKVFCFISITLKPLLQKFLVLKSCVVGSYGYGWHHDWVSWASFLSFFRNTTTEVKILISYRIYNGSEMIVRLNGSAEGVTTAPITMITTMACLR